MTTTKSPVPPAEPSHVRTTEGEQPQTYHSADAEEEQIPVLVKARGIALISITVLLMLYALQWARLFLVPMALGVLLAYTLSPVVQALEKVRVPRAVGAAVVLGLLLTGLAVGGNSLRTEFQSILVELPEATRKLVDQIRHSGDGRPSAIEQVQRAATELERAAAPQTPAAAAQRKQQKPPEPAATSRINTSDLVWAGSMGAIEAVAQGTMVIFLVFFLLVSGDTFKRKLVKLTGPSLSNKRITVQILDEINSSIQRYMFMLLVTNSMLALLMWGVLQWIGLENAGAWAVVAGFLHIVPYFGPLLVTGATGLSAFMQFESISTALLVAASSLAIATFIGIFVTTWMTGKIAKMNPTSVFVGLLFWGWLWGVWGLLLGIPIIVVIKVISEHVEDMHSIAELLSD